MTEELDRLRPDLLKVEQGRREAEQNSAELKGQLRDCKAEDIEALRQVSARTEVELQFKADEVGALAEKLAKVEQDVAEQKATLDAVVATIDGLRQSSADLNAALARLATVNPLLASSSANVQEFTPWYKRRWVLALACVALVVLIIAVGAVNFKLIVDMFGNSSASAP